MVNLSKDSDEMGEGESLAKYAFKSLTFPKSGDIGGGGSQGSEMYLMDELKPPSVLEMDRLRVSSDDERGDGAKSTPDSSAVEPLLHMMDHGETATSISCQVCLPFLIAGMGMVAAGIFLDVVQVNSRNLIGDGFDIEIPQNVMDWCRK